MDNLDNHDDRERFSNGEYGKLFSKSLNKLAHLDLTALEYKTVIYFMTLVRYGSGLLAYKNNRPVNILNVEKDLNFTHKTMLHIMQRLCDFRIISASYSGKETVYFFNPYIFSRGVAINKTLIEMFKKSEWAK